MLRGFPTKLSWVFVCTLLVLCGVLGGLQYRWSAEVSEAARDRLEGALRASLSRFNQEFNSEIANAGRGLLPPTPPPNGDAAFAGFVVRYEEWRRAGRNAQMFQRVGLAVPENGDVVLRAISSPTGLTAATDWPAEWADVREALRSHLRGGPGGGPPPDLQGTVFEVPVFRPGDGEAEWVIYDIDLQYLRDVLLPELLPRYLGTGGSVAYEVEIRTADGAPVYEFNPDGASRIGNSADASIDVFDPQSALMRAAGRGGPPGPSRGRWVMRVRHRAGSLEAVVAKSRWRNLAVTTGVLLLMIATLAALIRYTRRAQKLAEMQMDFVAGVSHELRTPLTVIHTAGYNLRGAVSRNPSQVERYGHLIQQESGRLKELVEQILRFSSAAAGRVIQDPEPLSVEIVVEDTIEASRATLDGAHCVVEKSVDPDLPWVLGDSMALTHALKNLVSNAVKYGTEASNWIGVFATRVGDEQHPAVEIRVVDRGPGIPAEEQDHVFDAFFRGRRALQDQVHGTGLGLSLVKKIVEAHGGSVAVRSEPGKGTEFVVRLPAAPEQYQNQFAGMFDGRS